MASPNYLLRLANEVIEEEHQSQEELHAIETAVMYRLKTKDMSEEINRLQQLVQQQREHIGRQDRVIDEMTKLNNEATTANEAYERENTELRNMIKSLTNKLRRLSAFRSAVSRVFDEEADPGLAMTSSLRSVTRSPAAGASPAPVPASPSAWTTSSRAHAVTPRRAQNLRLLLRDLNREASPFSTPRMPASFQ